MNHLTDEQLDAGTTDKQWVGFRAYLEGARDQYEFRTPIYEHLTVAINLVDTLEAEREAHQATKAELERYRKRADALQRAYRNALDAARQLADAVRGHINVPDYHRSVEMVDALAAYDAARAGQGKGE